MTPIAVRPVAEGLFTWPDPEPALIGGECTGCGTVSFPAQHRCVRCQSTEVERRELPRRGTLWTFTIQGFRPKEPYDDGGVEFVPYGVGYVELDGLVRVESRLLENDPDRLWIGMEVELRIVPLRTEPDGSEVVTFAFAPVAAAEAAGSTR